MNRQQLFTLFGCNLILFSLGNGLLPLLPVYATELGAGPALVGYYLAFAYAAMAIGTTVAGSLAIWLRGYKRALIIIGLGCAPAVGLMGQVQAVWQLAFLTALVWFCLGVELALSNIIIGLTVRPVERGKVFSQIYLAMPLGATIGGFSLGFLIGWAGYPPVFLILSFYWLLLPLWGWLGLPAESQLQGTQPKVVPAPAEMKLGQAFVLFLIITILAAVGPFVGRLGTSLVMKSMLFSPAAIAGTVAVGGLAALPFIPLFGSLSDRFSRRGLLLFTCLLTSLSLLLLSQAEALWQFWVATSLLSMSVYSSGSIASALATDLLPSGTLRRGLSLHSSTIWLAGVLGFILTGNLIEGFGAGPVFMGGAFLPVLAGALLPLTLPRRLPEPAGVSSIIN